jgi:hypothetical protein
MFCNTCGMPLESVARFCSRCGSPRPVVNVPAPPIRQQNYMSPSSPEERLRTAKILVAAACFMLGVIAFAALHGKAAGVAIIALTIFAFGWTNRSISLSKKVGFVLIALVLVIAANITESRGQAAIASERERARQEADDKQKAAEQQTVQEAENAFKQMTPEQHLEVVKKDFKTDAFPSQISEGMKHLEALKGTPLEKQGEELRVQYEARKTREEKARAAEEEKATATAQEQARIEYQKTIQNSLYDESMEVEVRAFGPKHTTLQLTYALASPMVAHTLSRFVEDWRTLGFKKVVLTNGLELANRSWVWNLDK